MLKRAVLGTTALLLAASGLAACGRAAADAKQGECLNGGGMMADLNKIKIVDCASPDAKYQVSAVLPANQKDKCPKDGMFTYSWQVNDSTMCVKSIKR
ncbi:LppU/SCO3897 family protein [Actinomadura kijaniata]|uniref:LppU/SCO3897 family protein n=1 Tax=Actinomadura kijaniata TaxID=46161 RepID=UPI003F1B10A2